MSATKTEFLNMRVSPATKKALRQIAKQEKRSMANALEWLIAEYFAINGAENSPKAERSPARAG